MPPSINNCTLTHFCPGTAFIYVLAIIINNNMNNETPVNNLLKRGPEVVAERVKGEPQPSFSVQVPPFSALSLLSSLPLVLASL